MAFFCRDCNLVWTLPKRFCPRCKSRDVKNSSAPFTDKEHSLSGASDGQVIQVLGAPEKEDE